jgi:hypothetical protein
MKLISVTTDAWAISEARVRLHRFYNCARADGE